jgi:hypothetical protein
VPEVGKPVAHDHLPRHADRGERFALERSDVARFSRLEVHAHVHQRAGEVLDVVEALVEPGRPLELAHQRLRIGSPVR